MDNQPKSLLDIFADDEIGLLDVKPATSNIKSEDERLVNSFEEINQFFAANQREPNPQNGMNERKLFTRLQGIRDNPEKVANLLVHDRFGLLKIMQKPVESLADIFADDSFDILTSSTDEPDLFDLRHVKLSDAKRAESDFVARRKACNDFAQFEAGFKAVHKDLVDGKRKFLPFTDYNLIEGNYYVHNGMLLLLESVNLTSEDKTLANGKQIRKDGRTRCIFENGTESNMLYRSLSKILYANGQVVSENNDNADKGISKDFNVITDEDEVAGFIYILKSKSTEPRIKEIENLYKIGYSTTDVQTRIKSAEKEPTYLMAPVSVIAEYTCYNMNPQKFEQLLHIFFGKACLNVDVFDLQGKRHTPQEWFIAPINVIERAIELIISGEIVKFHYDREQELIVAR